MAKDAVVLQDQLHFLRAQLQGQEQPQMFRPGHHLLFHHLVEQFLEMIVEAVEIILLRLA